MASSPRHSPRAARPATAPDTPQTPRRHRLPAGTRLKGTRPATLSLDAMQVELVKRLKLSFLPEPWQLHTISRILCGFDCIFLAGTGYGKSLIFEGLAALGGEGKVVIVICPLKALERDQVAQAEEKGLDAVLINEDNTRSAGIWKRARTTAQLIYISPEMASSQSFEKLWADTRFRGRTTALVVDEAHCAHEWGDDSFRPEYKELHLLRPYTGQEVPFVACTATATTDTFETIWTALGFGHRPFWGIDVGCTRPNLLFLIRAIKNEKNPVLDVLDLLPRALDASTPRTAIKKSLLYFDSEADCAKGVDTLRSALPPHLRNCVYSFSSGISEAGKAECWRGFKEGRYRILCCTDAAGMGCNVADVEVTVVFGCPKTLAVLVQRWGRTARRRKLVGTCLLLVRKWAFRPPPPEVGAAVQRLKGMPKAKLEPKTWKELLKKEL
ncbi:p-loop containing nucleoside triphosphate hydrolase protein [Mycena kentingensis (nom. inval.)]|nr:p-loop containing nucleoside triphosphate hydrolase protein [Mycena kentingensis (nom. inval.)]